MFQMNVGPQSFQNLFKGAQRQLEWIKISLIYEKIYQHQTICDSYDVELAAKFIQSVQLENFSSTYRLTGQLEYDVKKEDDMQLLYQMLIAYNCDGCSTAPLTQYKNDEIYQEITQRDEYGTSDKDHRVYIDMRRSKGYADELENLIRDDSEVNLTVNLKETAEKKMRL